MNVLHPSIAEAADNDSSFCWRFAFNVRYSSYRAARNSFGTRTNWYAARSD